MIRWGINALNHGSRVVLPCLRMMNKLLNFLILPWRWYQYRKKVKEKMAQSKKKDPYIYF